MNEEEYLAARLDDQLAWYDKKSQLNKRWHNRLRLTEICAAALIPFLSGLKQSACLSNWVSCWGDWVVAGLGVTIAVATASGALFKFQENWIQYRTTSEQLKHEKFTYLTGTAPYDGENRLSLLVDRVERLISKENSLWSETSKKEKPPEEGKG